MNNGFELGRTPGRGEGIFATRIFKAGEIVMRGVIEKELAENEALLQFLWVVSTSFRLPPGGGEGGAGMENTCRRGVGAHSCAFDLFGDGSSARVGRPGGSSCGPCPPFWSGEEARFLRIGEVSGAIAAIRGLR